MDPNRWINENLLKGSQVLTIATVLPRVLMPWGSWVLTIAHGTRLGTLCDFLNDWEKFAKLFKSVFGSYYTLNLNLARRRNIFCLIWMTPVVIHFAHVKTSHVMVDEVPSIVQDIFVRVISLNVIGIRTICYLKDFLLLQTLQTAYKQMLHGIKAQYGKCKSSITRKQVHDWVDLLSLLKLQAGRVQTYIELQCLWSIAEVFVTVLLYSTTLIFLFANDALNLRSQSNFLQFAIIFSSFFLFSLLWKAYLAESITSAVR